MDFLSIHFLSREEGGGFIDTFKLLITETSKSKFKNLGVRKREATQF